MCKVLNARRVGRHSSERQVYVDRPKAHHRAHLRAIESFAVAPLTDELTDCLLHLVEASCSSKSPVFGRLIFRLVIIHFDEPVLVICDVSGFLLLVQIWTMFRSRQGYFHGPRVT